MVVKTSTGSCGCELRRDISSNCGELLIAANRKDKSSLSIYVVGLGVSGCQPEGNRAVGQSTLNASWLSGTIHLAWR